MKKAKKIARYKIYFERSRTYLGYVQFMLILKIFLSDIGISSFGWMGICLVICTFFMFLIGWLDTYFGIRSRELEDNTYKNPFMTEMLDKIDKLLENQK